MRLADEEALIARFLRHRTPPLPPGGHGPGDDAAVSPWNGREDLVVTTDLVASGVHFFPDSHPTAIGRFLVAVNLSDLAAMGAEPRGFLASYGVPNVQGEVWFDELAMGVAQALSEWRCPLWGGDTKEAGDIVLAGTAFGAVPHGQAVFRTGGHVGDVLAVTGPIGGPGAVLEQVARGDLDEADAAPRILAVTPHLAAGVALRTAGVTAMTDLSDGLARGVRHLAAGARSGAELHVDRLPIAPEVATLWPAPTPADAEWRRVVLGTGGEYVLLAAIPAPNLEAARSAVAATGQTLTPVGALSDARGVRLHGDGAAWQVEALGWRHFRTNP